MNCKTRLASAMVLLLYFMSLLSATSTAQVRVELVPDVLMNTDTLWVDVRLTYPDSASVFKPISAYQFQVVTHDRLRFIRSDEAYTLTDKNGWTSGFNDKNGKVGAFSSTTDAIKEGGVLVRLQFVQEGTDTTVGLDLEDFRLNSGNPDHIPRVPSLRIDLTSHKE